MESDNSFARFRLLHINIERSILRECASEPSSIHNARAVSKLWIAQTENRQQSPFLCHMCGVFFTDPIAHIIVECSVSEPNRHLCYREIEECFGIITLFEVCKRTLRTQTTISNWQATEKLA